MAHEQYIFVVILAQASHRCLHLILLPQMFTAICHGGSTCNGKIRDIRSHKDGAKMLFFVSYGNTDLLLGK